MLLDDNACSAALCAHDVRFDGRFFVGVSSTGIYCRPVCRVRLPRKENCTFFISAAAAEAAGYRPCLRCRPELAPGLAPVDSVSRLAKRAVLSMEENFWAARTISDLADTLEITDRHLRRVFFSEYGVSPVQYLQTQRLLLAKNLLTDTQISMTDVAMISGFGSIRRFNDLFKNHYRLTPNRFRKVGSSMPENRGRITLFLGYRPPYAWDKLISFLAARAVPGVESVVENTYRRTVVIKKAETLYYGWVSISNIPKKAVLSVTLALSLLPVLSQVLAKIKYLFDVTCRPMEIFEKLMTMNKLSPDMCVPGIRVPGCFDPFEMSVRSVLGQQITVKAARTLAARFAAAFGEKIVTPFAELAFTFPQSDRIYALGIPIENHLGPLGIIGTRARSIFALAEALETGAIVFSHGADPEQEMEKLLKLPGLGPWTVQYIAMRVLGWPDAFLSTDYGVKKALSHMTPPEILTLSQAWSPWRSYATITLWNFLEENLKTKKASW